MFYNRIINPKYPENWIEYYKEVIEKSKKEELEKKVIKK